jgi:hypothetical protein
MRVRADGGDQKAWELAGYEYWGSRDCEFGEP